MKKAITFMLTLVIAVVGMTMHAQAPQTGVYRIQNVGAKTNVGGKTYVKVTGKYDATLVKSQQDASYITVGIEKKLSDGTYKVNSLASTYGSENTPVEVYDYLTKALTLGEIELRRELEGSSEPNIQRAIRTMHQIVEEYGFMRMMPVDGQADTYHAIAVLPNIPDSVETEWAKKVPQPYTSPNTGGHDMWDWCIDIVYRYLNEHSGEGGTNAALAAKIRNNLKNIKEGHTYMLTADEDGSFGYIDVTGSLTSSNNRSWWKLTPKVNTDNVKDGTYKIRNLGTKQYVSIKSKYYAKPDAEEGDASDIRITFNGEAYGGQKIVNLGGKAPDGTNIEIYDYIKKAIMIGKVAIADVLKPDNNDGVNPASPENVVVAQETMENFVKDNAFMCMKPVPDKDDAVYAYAYIPEIPAKVAEAMYEHGALSEYGVTSSSTLADMQAAAWKFGVKKVKQYLNDHNGEGGTDNTLRSYILANIDKIKPNTTYYLSAHPSDGTFDYAPETATETQAAADLNDEHYMWGFDVEEVEEDNLTSGTYKIRNVEYKNYVEVLSKYYAKPDTDEENATKIHITYNGKLDDGSYKVTNMSAVAKDGSQCDIADYIQKAIKVARVAIADVLKGEDPNAHVASDENIAYAQQYLEDFVNENAYMRVKPVVGTNYVYAIATIPEIPKEVVNQMQSHGVIEHVYGEGGEDEAWEYGVNYVMTHLAGHNSTLVQLIRANLPKIKQGHTYYLSEESEDDNKTFGYLDYDEGEVDLSNKAIQWGIDLEEEDQPVESDFYKIHNVGNDKYVKVQGRYYAAPDADKASATPIAVTIDGMLEDGSMKVTNLVGDGHDIQKYVDHAIEIGTTLIHQILDNQSTYEHVQRAIKEMTNFVRENAYMRVKLVPGETNAYYAYVVLPTVPQYIVDEWEKKYPNYTGTMRDWAVQKVKDYLKDHPQVDGKLASMISNNIDKLYEGHTYYLRADGDNTFGIGDFNTGEVTLTDPHYWWGFADAIKAEKFEGYYRIKGAGADGKYVNVTGKFAAAPNATADEAKSAAGSVIYVGTGETKNTKTLPLEILRSQGVDVGSKSEFAYMNMISNVLKTVAGTVAQMATEYVHNSSYSQYEGLIEPMVQTLVESVDLDLYVEPTITSDGQNAYMLEVNIPDLKEYCSLAQDALSLMGKHGSDLVDNLEALKKGDGGVIDKIISAAQDMAVMLDHGNDAADEIWALLKQKGKTFLSSYSQQLSQLNIPEQALTFINNALNNPDFNYGTTYCLRQDADGTFGYASRESLIDSDNAKWILEPFKEEDPNYDAETYMPFVVKAELTENIHTGEQNVGETSVSEAAYNFTTTYLDFEAQVETDNVEIYTISETKRLTSKRNAVGDTPEHTSVYYIAKLSQINGNVIPAATPVVLRSSGDAEIELRPINKPEHKAVESGELAASIEQLLKILYNKINGGTQGVPAPKAISEPTTTNLLVGSFFDEAVGENMENNYLELGNKTLVQDDQPIGLDMDGLGFWKNNVETLKGNNAYLLGYDEAADKILTDFNYGTSFDAGKDGDAPGYIFQFKDGTFTRIENVTTPKEVKSVTYYNTLGIESSNPFEGINIIVTTYTDGSSSAIKVIK